MSLSRWMVGVAAVALLSACAGPAVKRGPAMPAAVAEQAQRARAEILSAHPQWSLQGRVALSNGTAGGSGRIEWHQAGPRYAVALSAPITRQSWRLSGDAGSARLEGLESGTRSGTDPEALLQDATGWVIPVGALSSWVRGTADATLPGAAMQFASDGHLAVLEQAGWSITYSHWQPQPGLGIDLPGRLDASRGDARVRLVVDRWQDGALP